MWGAIGGAVGGGTTSVLESVGSSTAGNYVRQNLIEGGMDTAVDLAESASKGGLTPEGVLTSVVTNMAGAFIGAPDTPSTTRKQALDSVADNRTVKNAVVDGTDYIDNAANTSHKINPLENIEYTDKVKNQMKQGDYHSFPESVEAFGADGKISQIEGGDGVIRTKVEIPGSYKNKDGVFEFIIEPDGKTVNHRYFNPNK